MEGSPKALVVLTGPSQEGLPDGARSLRQLESVANRPVLAHVLDQISGSGVEEVGLVVDESVAQRVRAIVEDGRQWGLRARYLLHEERLGTGDAILAAEGFLEGRRFLLHHGDFVLEGSLAPLLEHAASPGLDCLVVAQRRVRDWVDRGVADGAPLIGRSELPLRMLMDAGGVPAVVLGPRILRRLRGLKRSWRGQIELAEGVDGLRSEGGRVEVRAVRGWRFGGSVDDLLAGNRALLDRLVERHAAQPRESHAAGRVIVHPSALIENSVIRGPSVVGAGAQVIDSHVGPYSSIGAGALVEGSEVEDLIIGNGAAVTRLGRRLAASVVGPGSRLTRGFGVSDALRVKLGAGAEIVWS